MATTTVPPTFSELIQTLSPEEQKAVVAFIRYLRERTAPSKEIALEEAYKKFSDRHRELLQLLAK